MFKGDIHRKTCIFLVGFTSSALQGSTLVRSPACPYDGPCTTWPRATTTSVVRRDLMLKFMQSLEMNGIFGVLDAMMRQTIYWPLTDRLQWRDMVWLWSKIATPASCHRHGWLVGQMSGRSVPGTSVSHGTGTYSLGQYVGPLWCAFLRWDQLSPRGAVESTAPPAVRGSRDPHVTSRFAHKDLHIVDYLTCHNFWYSSLYIAHDQTCIFQTWYGRARFHHGKKNTYVSGVFYFLP